ncbi:MAG: hypothetical protein ACRCXC_09025 [Legionella sp.]
MGFNLGKKQQNSLLRLSAELSLIGQDFSHNGLISDSFAKKMQGLVKTSNSWILFGPSQNEQKIMGDLEKK